jgi:hypothetical protein
MGYFPPLATKLALTDRRYTANGGAAAGEAAAMRTLGALSPLVLTPLCLAAFYGVSHRKTWRQTVAAIALTAQAALCVLCYAPEILTGCLNLPPFGQTGCLAAPLDGFHGIFFWFGIFTRGIAYVAVPAIASVMYVRDDVREKRTARARAERYIDARLGTTPRSAADAATPAKLARAQVSFLCTVTFHANLAHSLTRSPSHISAARAVGGRAASHPTPGAAVSGRSSSLRLARARAR